jgi:cytochrome c-type biogenesis protein CcmH/NrfG
MKTMFKTALAISAALAFSAALTPALRADALDDELAAIKKLLLADQEEEAAPRLDALEARARITASSSPSDAHVHYILGMAAMYAGHDAAAQAALEKAVALNPKNAQYVLGRAQLALYQSKPKDAVTVLTKFTAGDDKTVEVWDLLGEAQDGDQQFAAAQESYQKAAALAPKETKYQVKIGQMLVKQHKDADALATFQKALDADPKNATVLGSMAEVYESQNNLDKAIEFYGRMVALNTADYRALGKQVQLYQAQGKAKERDAAHDKIAALKKAGKIGADSFCREQFTQDKSTVIVMEYFEPKGLLAVRYAFNVLGADGKSVDKRITMAYAAEATAQARAQGRIKSSERISQLDVYTVNKEGDISGHQTYAQATGEPTYDETRELVKQYFAGALKPVVAGTKPTTKPATQTGSPK